MIASPDYVGIDVSKQHLDLAMGETAVLRVPNTQAGMRRLIARLEALRRSHVVCEATGSHTRLILRFARLMQPQPDPHDPYALVLTDLVRRRRQMVDMLAMEKQRSEHPEGETVKASIKAHIGFLSTQIAAIDKQITQHITQHAGLRRRAELLASIPGIGQVTAAVLIAEMPELGSIGNKQVAALAGVAPFVHDSGQMRGQAHIMGGRLSVRCALYMATISAIRANPPIKAFYQRLRSQGKPAKLAIVAAMRKLLTTANAILANDTPWTASPA